jgi:hypothetical protein
MSSKQLLFNAKWVKLTSEKDIAEKLRSFVQRNTSEKTSRPYDER